MKLWPVFATTRVPEEAVKIVSTLRQFIRFLRGPPAVSVQRLLLWLSMARGAIAEALRSLAKALDQIEAEEAADRWEVVSREEAGVDKGDCAEGKEQTASSGQDSGELATGSLVAYKIDIRHYVVLAQPEYPQDFRLMVRSCSYNMAPHRVPSCGIKGWQDRGLGCEGWTRRLRPWTCGSKPTPAERCRSIWCRKSIGALCLLAGHGIGCFEGARLSHHSRWGEKWGSNQCSAWWWGIQKKEPRGGGPPMRTKRRYLSTLAKLTDAVLSLKPSIKEKFAESGVRNKGAASSESQRLPPVVDPLPFSGSDEARLRKPSSASSMVWSLMMRMVAKRWVTLLVVLVCLLFPRLVAVVIVAFLRLVLRLLFIVFSRLLAEVWSEVQHLMVQVVLASNSFEDYLISSLEGLDRPHWHVPVPQPVPTTPAPQTSLVGGAHGGAPFPPWAPPWLPLSIFALAAALLRRPAGPGGVGWVFGWPAARLIAAWEVTGDFAMELPWCLVVFFEKWLVTFAMDLTWSSVVFSEKWLATCNGFA